MKTFKKLTKLFIAFTLLLGLTGCNSGKGFEDATYATIYDSQTAKEVLDALPEYQFLKDDVRKGIDDGMVFEITLVLESMGDYTLVMHLFNPNQTDPAASDYLEIRLGVIGCYTKDGDVVTIEPGEWGDAQFKAGTDYIEKYKSFSFAEDGSTGDFYSESNPEILELVPAATFTVSNLAITGWEITE